MARISGRHLGDKWRVGFVFESRSGPALFAAGLFLISTALLSSGSLLAIALPELRLQVQPDAIPVSGEWSVAPCLFYLDKCISVDISVTMDAFLFDKTHFVRTANTTSGVVSFIVPTNTLYVQFTARYGYTISVHYISGPSVVPYDYGVGLLFLTFGMASLYIIPSWPMWRHLRKAARRQLVPALVGLLASLTLPLAYIISAFPLWFGTGWLPVSALGIPLYFLPLPSVLSFVVLLAWYTKIAVGKFGWRKVLQDLRDYEVNGRRRL